MQDSFSLVVHIPMPRIKQFLTHPNRKCIQCKHKLAVFRMYWSAPGYCYDCVGRKKGQDEPVIIVDGQLPNAKPKPYPSPLALGCKAKSAERLRY